MRNIDYFEDGSFKPLNHRVKLIGNPYEKSLIVADLHLGIELEFLRQGVSIQGISEETITDLVNIVDINDPANIIFLGDTKHSFGATKFEKRLLEKLVNEITQISDARLVFGKGNHDPNIEKLLPSKGFPIFSGKGKILETDEGTVGLAHGHQIPVFQEIDEIILGHVHPTVYLREFHSKSQDTPFQSFYRFPVLLTGEISYSELKIAYRNNKQPKSQSIDQSKMIRILILPGFNKILSSSRIGSSFSIYPSQRSIQTFIDRIFTLIDFEVILLDGTYLGFLSELNQRVNAR